MNWHPNQNFENLLSHYSENKKIILIGHTKTEFNRTTLIAIEKQDISSRKKHIYLNDFLVCFENTAVSILVLTTENNFKPAYSASFQQYMKLSVAVAVETEETGSSTETESLPEHTPRRMSDPEKKILSSVSVTSQEVGRQIKAVIGPLTQQLTHLCELMQELRNEQAHRCREETTCSRAASTFTGSAGRTDSN